MGETPKMDREAFKEQVRAELEKLMDEVADAVDDAPYGYVIRDSEEPVRDALAKFRETVYAKALQGKIDAAEASFSPSDEPGDEEADAEQGPPEA